MSDSYDRNYSDPEWLRARAQEEVDNPVQPPVFDDYDPSEDVSVPADPDLYRLQAHGQQMSDEDEEEEDPLELSMPLSEATAAEEQEAEQVRVTVMGAHAGATLGVVVFVPVGEPDDSPSFGTLVLGSEALQRIYPGDVLSVAQDAAQTYRLLSVLRSPHRERRLQNLARDMALAQQEVARTRQQSDEAQARLAELVRAHARVSRAID